MLYDHHYTNTTDETCKVVLEAGMDIECGNFMTQFLEQAFNDSAVTLQDMDTALFNQFSTQVGLHLFIFRFRVIKSYVHVDYSSVSECLTHPVHSTRSAPRM